MNLKQQRDAELAEARAIIDRVRADGRTSLTDDERKAVNGHLAKADEMKAQMDNGQHDAAGATPKAGDPFAGFARTKTGDGKRFSGRVALRDAAKAIGNPDGLGFKALAPSGSAVAPAGLVTPDPVRLGQPTNGLLNAIRAEKVANPPTYDYLRQVTRTNNAAPVATGGTKPTSVYSLVRAEDRLKVIAHLSEPINKYWLQDLPSLERFMADELGYGIELAVEAQVVNGDGTGENLLGFANVSGIQLQTFSTDRFETLRKSLTKLQNVGAVDPIIVLNPLDWEAMDLTRVTGSNEFLVRARTSGDASPTGSNPLLSWGVEVVLSTSTAVGTAYAMDKNAAVLYTDGQTVVEWDSATGFAKNEILARCEGRFGLAVEKPLQVVKATIAGA